MVAALESVVLESSDGFSGMANGPCWGLMGCRELAPSLGNSVQTMSHTEKEGAVPQRMYVSLFFQGYLVAFDSFQVLAADDQEEVPVLIGWVENSNSRVCSQLVSILQTG